MTRGRKERGSIEVMVVCGLAALLACSALVLDFGMVSLRQQRLENALENAAISGAHFLVTSEATARAKALEYLASNGEDPNRATVTISNGGRRLEVTSSRVVDLTTARVFGFASKEIKSKATAIIGPFQSIQNGIRPIGVEMLSYQYGDEVVLKEGAGSGVFGNYGSIALGGTGNAVYENNLLHGYSGRLSLGDLVPTEPGNKAGTVNKLSNYLKSFPETFSNYTASSDRLWTLPLVEKYDPRGREDLKVVAFAKFFIEDVQMKGGSAEITGRFVQFVDLGEVNQNLPITGLYGVQLIR